MATTYVSERQVEYWTSRQIEDFFMNAGFDMLVYPIAQRDEKYLPADHIFGVGGSAKLFGIQYKVLYQNGEDHWRMNARQHSMLKNFPWIYYGLSDLKSATGFRNSLHYLRLYNNLRLCENNRFVSKLPVSSKKSYTRWAKFYERLLQCHRGCKVNSKEELISYLMPSIEEERPNRVIERINEMADVFVINVKSRKAVHLSSQPRLGSIEE